MYLKEIGKQLEDLKLGAGSDLSIVDENNKIIYSTIPDKTSTDSVIKLPTDTKAAKKDSFETTNQDGNEVLAMYSQFNSMNWKLLGTVPVNELVKDAAQIRNITWIFSAIAALLAIAIGLLVIRMVAIPLINLRNLMNEGQQGNLSVRSKVDKKDEIGQLSQSFNQMMAQITALVTQTNQSAQDV